MAGAAGFEPAMADPKSAALPLGHAPPWFQCTQAPDKGSIVGMVLRVLRCLYGSSGGRKQRAAKGIEEGTFRIVATQTVAIPLHKRFMQALGQTLHIGNQCRTPSPIGDSVRVVENMGIYLFIHHDVTAARLPEKLSVGVDGKHRRVSVPPGQLLAKRVLVGDLFDKSMGQMTMIGRLLHDKLSTRIEQIEQVWNQSAVFVHPLQSGMGKDEIPTSAHVLNPRLLKAQTGASLCLSALQHFRRGVNAEYVAVRQYVREAPRQLAGAAPQIHNLHSLTYVHKLHQIVKWSKALLLKGQIPIRIPGHDRPYFTLGTLVRMIRACALFLIVLLAPMLSDCGSHGATGRTLTIWYGTDDPVERGWTSLLVQGFQSTHPHITVHLQVLAFSDMNTKLQLALSAGDPPDLAYTTPRGPGIPAYVAAHRLRNLATVSRNHGWSRRLRPDLLTAYNQPFVHAGLPADGVAAVPMALAAVGMMYNVQLLRRLHLQVPASLPQFEIALARAKAMRITPLGLGNADGWLGDDWYLTLVNALEQPAILQQEQRLSPAFSFIRSAACLRAARLLRQWADRGYFTSDFGGLEAQEGINEFFRGHTLFQLISSSQNAQISHDQRQTHLQVGIFAFPHRSSGGVMPQSGYEGWVVPQAAGHPQEAYTFLDYVLSSKTRALLLGAGQIPALRRVRAQPGMERWLQQYIRALNTSRPGVYLDAAPISNLNATMEANVQLLLQGYERPEFLVRSLQQVYASRGRGGSGTRIDGEF